METDQRRYSRDGYSKLASAAALKPHGTYIEVIESPDAHHENVMYVDTPHGQAAVQVVRELLDDR